jgi:hypothetical protein
VDPIVHAKSSALAEAFANLLAIHNTPAPSTGRIHQRTMVHNGNPFLQFIFRGADQQDLRFVSVEFHQRYGFFYLYTDTEESMYPYLPHKKGHVQQGFNYRRFTQERPAFIFTLAELNTAAQMSVSWLTKQVFLQRKNEDQLQATMRDIQNFAAAHGVSGAVPLDLGDLQAIMKE